jgi:hypothetical protein
MTQNVAPWLMCYVLTDAMSISLQGVRVASWFFAVGLGLTFAWLWYRVVWSKESRSWHLAIPLACGTLSFLFLLLCAAVPSAMGRSHTPFRYHLIEANCFVSFLAALVAFTRLKIDGFLTGLSCIFLAFSWIFVLAVNSVV